MRIINLKKGNKETAIRLAAAAIKAGKLVVFPTETVYGLGADALSKKAVAAIFKLKKRPKNDPLIVHIADKKDLYRYAEVHRRKRKTVKKLISVFWPGPLTIILKKKKVIPDIVTAGLDTVAVRMPDHRIARALIRRSGRPVAAPSANLFSRPSSTEAAHIREDFKKGISVVLDAGPSKIGLESTVLDLTVSPPVILRQGAVTREMLADKTGLMTGKPGRAEGGKSPGFLKKHYSPKARLYYFDPQNRMEIKKAGKMLSGKKNSCGLIITRESAPLLGCRNKIISGGKNDFRAFGKNLFSAIRKLDRMNCSPILVEKTEEKGLGSVIMERLRKAGTNL